MPDPTTVELPESGAEAMFGANTAQAGWSAEKRARWEAGQKIRRERSKNASERSIAESFTPHPPPTEARVHHVNEENFGMRRNGGKGPDAGERRYRVGERSLEFRKKADKFASLSQELLTKGYDGLEDTQGIPDAKAGNWVKAGVEAFSSADKKDFLVKEMLEAAKSWPAARAVLESYGPEGNAAADAARRQLMEQMLRDPKFLKHLTANFGEVFNGDNAILQEIVVEAQEEFEKAKAKKEAKEAELKEVTDALTPIEAKFISFQPGGADFTRINALETAQANWATDLRTATSDVARLQAELRSLAARQYQKRTVRDYDSGNNFIGTHEEIIEDPVIASRIGVAQTELTTAQTRADNIEKEQNELNALREEREKVAQRRAELREKQAALTGELGEVDAKFESAKAKYDAQKALRIAQEEEFKNKIEGMFREAGRRYIKDEAQAYEAFQSKLAEKAVAEASDRDEKKIQEMMKNNWRKEKRVGRFGRARVSEVNKDRVGEDYARFIRERNMDWFVKDSMETYLRTLTPGSQEYIEERARLDERYKDKDFMQKMGTLTSERLLKNYLESGNKLRGEDVSILLETDQGMAAVEAALNKNEAVASAIEKLKEQSAFRGTRGEFMKKLAKSPKAYGILAGILALLFGAPFIIAGASVMGGIAGSAYVDAVKEAY